jgi:hypothetical protein
MGKSAGLAAIRRRRRQRGVPVLDIGGKIIAGFDKPKINDLLGLNGN